MSEGVLDVVNHLLREWLSARMQGVGAFQLRDLQVEASGARIVARIDHPQAAGELVIRIEVRTDAPGRYLLRLRPEAVPDTLGALWEPFRNTLETAQATLELRFDAGTPDGDSDARG